MPKPIEVLLEDIRLLGEAQFQIVQQVRDIARKMVKPLTEEVKYGGILFSSTYPFAGVFAYKEHVTVEFGQGAKIQDVDGFLEGAGKGRRHIKLRSLGDIHAKKLSTYIQLALKAASGEA